jgi:tetratricopeptide (TPR) repeat protein
MRLNQDRDALDYFKKAVDVELGLIKTQPGNPALRRRAAASFGGWGDALSRVNGAPSAKQFYERARDLATDAVKADAAPDSKLLLAKSLRQCGNVSLATKDPKTASMYFQNALKIDNELAATVQDNPDLQLGLAQDWFGAGAAARSNKDENTAIRSFMQAQDIVLPLRTVKSAATAALAEDLYGKIVSSLKVTGR